MQQPPQSGGATPPAGYTPPPPALRRDVAPPSGGGGLNIPVLTAIAVVVILIVLVVIAAVGKIGPFSAPAKQTTWTAVFLTDNEVFFGHITVNDDQHMVLQNVYYLQKPTSQQQSSTPASINSLVTNQLQCPTDEINIKASNILYWETLQSSSYVVQRLQQIMSTQNNNNCPQPQASSAATPAPSAAPTAASTPTARAN